MKRSRPADGDRPREQLRTYWQFIYRKGGQTTGRRKLAKGLVTRRGPGGMWGKVHAFVGAFTFQDQRKLRQTKAESPKPCFGNWDGGRTGGSKKIAKAGVIMG